MCVTVDQQQFFRWRLRNIDFRFKVIGGAQVLAVSNVMQSAT